MKDAFLKESTHESDPLVKTFYKSIADFVCECGIDIFVGRIIACCD